MHVNDAKAGLDKRPIREWDVRLAGLAVERFRRCCREMSSWR